MSDITLNQYESLRSIIITSFDACLAKRILTISNNQNENKTNYIEKVFGFYLKYEPIDLFKSNVIKNITEEVFTDPELYNLIFNQSHRVGLEIANDQFESLDIASYISNTISNIQKNEPEFSLIPKEVLMESSVNANMLYHMLKNNFWYICVYLTISYITDSEFYKSLFKTGV